MKPPLFSECHPPDAFGVTSVGQDILARGYTVSSLKDGSRIPNFPTLPDPKARTNCMMFFFWRVQDFSHICGNKPPMMISKDQQILSFNGLDLMVPLPTSCRSSFCSFVGAISMLFVLPAVLKSQAWSVCDVGISMQVMMKPTLIRADWDRGSPCWPWNATLEG